MKALLLGPSGQLGREIIKLADADDIALVPAGRDAADLSRAGSLAALVAAEACDVVVNASAYTGVDRAESEAPSAWRLNAGAILELGLATAARGMPVVHVSTDYVFDGSKPEPYVETDPIGPLGVYGASKAAGEIALRQANPRHVILRTAWLYSPHRQNFVKTMLRLGRSRRQLKVVNEQVGCPTSAADLARGVWQVLRRLGEARWGTYHFVNGGSASWHEFACAIFELAAEHFRPPPEILPIPASAYPTPARRPANSRLDTACYAAAFGLAPRHWRAALAEALPGIVAATLAETA